MQTLRATRLLARLMLVWFVLALGAAIASPMVQPKSLELVCSGAGAMKLVLKSEGGEPPAFAHTLDCPICASLGAPPSVARLAAEPPQPLAHVMRRIPAAHIAWLTAAPLPARGPPLL